MEDDGATVVCHKRGASGSAASLANDGEPLDPHYRDPRLHPQHDNSDVTVEFDAAPLWRSTTELTGVTMRNDEELRQADPGARTSSLLRRGVVVGGSWRAVAAGEGLHGRPARPLGVRRARAGVRRGVRRRAADRRLRVRRARRALRGRRQLHADGPRRRARRDRGARPTPTAATGPTVDHAVTRRAPRPARARTRPLLPRRDARRAPSPVGRARLHGADDRLGVRARPEPRLHRLPPRRAAGEPCRARSRGT